MAPFIMDFQASNIFIIHARGFFMSPYRWIPATPATGLVSSPVLGGVKPRYHLYKLDRLVSGGLYGFSISRVFRVVLEL